MPLLITFILVLNTIVLQSIHLLTVAIPTGVRYAIIRECSAVNVTTHLRCDLERCLGEIGTQM